MLWQQWHCSLRQTAYESQKLEKFQVNDLAATASAGPGLGIDMTPGSAIFAARLSQSRMMRPAKVQTLLGNKQTDLGTDRAIEFILESVVVLILQLQTMNTDLSLRDTL